MLSNPWVESSDGRNFVGIHFQPEQVADRIRVFGAVEAVETRRGKMRGRAGGRARSPASRSALSRVAGSGRGIPDGGIIPARSFRTTFSPTCAWSPRRARSSLSSIRFAVLSFSLWQVTQYRSRSARCAATSGAGEASAFGACCCGTTARARSGTRGGPLRASRLARNKGHRRDRQATSHDYFLIHSSLRCHHCVRLCCVSFANRR